MKKLLLLCWFVTICSSLKAMDTIPLKQVIEEKRWDKLISRMIDGTVTSKELYAYNKSSFEGNDRDNGWPLCEELAYYLGYTLYEKKDGHGTLTHSHTSLSKRYLNIIEQLITMGKISIPEDLADNLVKNSVPQCKAITSAGMCRNMVAKVTKHLDHINMLINSKSWHDLAIYMHQNSLSAAYVMHLSSDQNQKLITKLTAVGVDLFDPIGGSREYTDKICAELSQKNTLDSHNPDDAHKTFFNITNQKYLGLATLCIIIGIVTYKYYHASPENEDEKEQEEVSAA